MTQYNQVGCGRRIKMRLTAGRTFRETWEYLDQNEGDPTHTGTAINFTPFSFFRIYIAATETSPNLYVINTPGDNVVTHTPAYGSVNTTSTPTDGKLLVIIDETVTRALQDTHGLKAGVFSVEGDYTAGTQDLGQGIWRLTNTPEE